MQRGNIRIRAVDQRLEIREGITRVASEVVATARSKGSRSGRQTRSVAAIASFAIFLSCVSAYVCKIFGIGLESHVGLRFPFKPMKTKNSPCWARSKSSHDPWPNRRLHGLPDGCCARTELSSKPLHRNSQCGVVSVQRLPGTPNPCSWDVCFGVTRKAAQGRSRPSEPKRRPAALRPIAVA